MIINIETLVRKCSRNIKNLMFLYKLLSNDTSYSTNTLELNQAAIDEMIKQVKRIYGDNFYKIFSDALVYSVER